MTKNPTIHKMKIDSSQKRMKNLKIYWTHYKNTVVQTEGKKDAWKPIEAQHKEDKNIHCLLWYEERDEAPW